LWQPDPEGDGAAPTATDISDVMYAVEGVLDASIAAEGYVIPEKLIDLSKIDLDALKKAFKSGRKRSRTTQVSCE
jgi:hypothetical protein